VPASISRRLAVLDQQFGGGAPTNWLVGLSAVEPAQDGTGYVEPPAGVAYARLVVPNNPTSWPAATVIDGRPRKRNGTLIKYADPTGPWGKLYYWLLLTGSSGGAAEYWGRMPESAPALGRTPVQFAIGDLSIPL
jgi:hypothetical protein